MTDMYFWKMMPVRARLSVAYTLSETAAGVHALSSSTYASVFVFRFFVLPADNIGISKLAQVRRIQ